MSTALPFLELPDREILPRFSELLPPLLRRIRTEVRTGFLPDGAEVAGAVEALVVDSLRALSSATGTDLPASETGARISVARRALERAGPRGMEAFERAFLVKSLIEFRAAASAGGFCSPAVSWEFGLPAAAATAANGDPELLVLSARAAEKGFGSGLAVAGVAHGKAAMLTLLVPEHEAPGPVVWALSLVRRF